MRYLVIYRPENGQEGGMPDPVHIAAMGELVERMTKAGKLIGTEPLGVRARGGRVRRSGDAFEVSDETGRAAGYAFLQADSREEALELCKEFLRCAGDGVTELRQVMEFGPPPA